MKFRNKVAAIVALAVIGNTLTGATSGASAATDGSVAADGSLPTVTAWKTVIDDKFNSGGLPAHWKAYNSQYSSGVQSCAVPSHNTVGNGYLHLKFYYEPSSAAGKCGAAWYSGGLSLGTAHSSVSQRITLRFRVVQTGWVVAHRILPMRWPDASNGAKGGGAGEEDYCESESMTFCSTFLHHRDTVGRTDKKYVLDLSRWHTFQVTRNAYTVNVKIDDRTVFDFRGDSQSLPPTLKHVVLQQECSRFGCPLTKFGMEDIQIDWIRVENPA